VYVVVGSLIIARLGLRSSGRDSGKYEACDFLYTSTTKKEEDIVALLF